MLHKSFLEWKDYTEKSTCWRSHDCFQRLDFFLRHVPASPIVTHMKTVRSGGAGSSTCLSSLRRVSHLLVMVCSLLCFSLADIALPAAVMASPGNASAKTSASAVKKESPAWKKTIKAAASKKKKQKTYVRSLASQEDRTALLERGISSGFGNRAISRKKTRMHMGIDVPAPTGSKIVAFNDGEVIFAGVKNGYGKTVIIRQIDGREALYAHMNKYVVSTGDTVRRGDHVGHVGRTGRATGYHLHFEIIDEGQNLDPALHVWHGSELVLGPGDLDPDSVERTRVAEPVRRHNVNLY